MRTEGVLGKPWVRTCLLIPPSVILYAGLVVLCAILSEGGHRTLGDVVGDLDLATLLAALFLGPVWVLQAFHAPTPPGNNGPPDGHGGPVPVPTPDGSAALDVMGVAPVSPDEVDDELRRLLDQATVSSSRS
jgi:hypothetical protein